MMPPNEQRRDQGQPLLQDTSRHVRSRRQRTTSSYALGRNAPLGGIMRFYSRLSRASRPLPLCAALHAGYMVPLPPSA